MPFTTNRPLADYRLSSTPFFLCSSTLTRRSPDVADRLGLTLNVRDEGWVVGPLQPLLDESPEDDLKAHRQLERGRRLPREDSGPIHNVLGKDEKDLGLVRQQHTSRLLPPCPRSSHHAYYTYYNM